MKKIASVLALALSLSMVLTACGSKEETPAASTTTPSTSTSQSTQAPATESTDKDGYTFRTSESNRVVTEGGAFTKENAEGPVLITSLGQSADVSMLDALMKKSGASDYTFNATASAEEVAGYKTVIIACGASSKGLGAAGISQEDELARGEAIVKAAQDNGITVIAAHLGGSARRGALSDKFNDMTLACANYILVVEEGNNDNKFTDFAADKGIPCTLLFTIADALKPLFA